MRGSWRNGSSSSGRARVWTSRTRSGPLSNQIPRERAGAVFRGFAPTSERMFRFSAKAQLSRTMPRSLISFHLVFFTLLLNTPQGWAAPAPSTETVEQALCRLIEGSAASHRIPVAVLTKLIWRESSFRAQAVSRAGAQGVAQFMPGTARERGLADPFDPEQAIPKAAEFVADLTGRFGNFGLAAAAYNAGPARVSAWLSGQGTLPAETQNYVLWITGQSVEDWTRTALGNPIAAPLASRPSEEAGQETAPEQQSCLQVIATLRRPGADDPGETPFAPWGVQLAGNFSKQRALAAFARAIMTYESLLGGSPPMVIGTRLRSRGTRAFYRVRVPAATRTEANSLCDRIRKSGGSCIVLPS